MNFPPDWTDDNKKLYEKLPQLLKLHEDYIEHQTREDFKKLRQWEAKHQVRWFPGKGSCYRKKGNKRWLKVKNVCEQNPSLNTTA